jgi:hypothetical protein
MLHCFRLFDLRLFRELHLFDLRLFGLRLFRELHIRYMLPSKKT